MVPQVTVDFNRVVRADQRHRRGRDRPSGCAGRVLHPHRPGRGSPWRRSWSASRPPSAANHSRERWRLEREAVTDSRPAKVHGFDAEVLHEGWADQARAIGYEPERVLAAAVGPALDSHPIDHTSRTEVAAAALAALAEGQSTWRAAEVSVSWPLRFLLR